MSLLILKLTEAHQLKIRTDDLVCVRWEQSAAESMGRRSLIAAVFRKLNASDSGFTTTTNNNNNDNTIIHYYYY